MTDTATFDIAHFDRLAEEFDRFAPYLEAVTTAILERLPKPDAGWTVLDLSCGTGEPGLTLARRSPDCRVIGLDAAESMIAVARRKVERGPGNIRFEMRPNEAPALEDGSADAAISRFGFLLFGDPVASAAALARILTPGAPFSFAVWGPLGENTFMEIVLGALRTRVPDERLPQFGGFERLAVAGARETILREAGFDRVEHDVFDWRYEIADADLAWSFVASPGMFAPLLADLGEDGRSVVREELGRLLSLHQAPGGGFAVPQRCRLLFGRR